jgi:hypothetical protein
MTYANVVSTLKRADVGQDAIDSARVRDGSLLAKDFAAAQLQAGA